MRGTLAQVSAVIAVICAAASVAPSALAASTSADREIEHAYEQALAASIAGPANIPIAEQAELKLPANFSFIPAVHARRLMTAIGNSAGANMKGIVVRQGETRDWFVTVEFEATGYVDPAIAKTWTTSSILGHMKASEDRMNERRRELGTSRLKVEGFILPPAYDEAAHRLSFATRIDETGPSMADEASINFDAYAFGREAIVNLTLVCPESDFEKRKPHLEMITQGLGFLPGFKAADFKPGKHNVMANPALILFEGLSAGDAELRAAQDRKVAALAAIPAESQPVRQVRRSALPGNWMTWVAIAVLALGAVLSLMFAFLPGRDDQGATDHG